LLEILTDLHLRRELSDPSAPPIDAVLAPLDRLVRDAKQPNAFRRLLLEILFEHGDPNRYLDLAIVLTSTEKTPAGRAQAFIDCTPFSQPSMLSVENRKKWLRRAFHLLEEIDDGVGGGYFLALAIGRLIGIESIRPGLSPFQSDSRLAEYQEAYGLSKRFFQEPVERARKWWDQNKEIY
jgi:hypothetical protein